MTDAKVKTLHEHSQLTEKEPNTKTMKTGIELIAEERTRQIEKDGWTPEHDDGPGHEAGEMAEAAGCYAEFAAMQSSLEDPAAIRLDRKPWDWPWEAQWWKPSKDRVRNLVKAGALIAAEIDRLQRLQKR